MSLRDTEERLIATGRNTARYFTENRHVAWVALVATLLWGAYSYWQMPKRKDPELPIRLAVVVCQWPGASAERIEQLVTRKIEEKVAQNATVERIQSVSRSSVSVVYVILEEGTKEVGKQFDDVKLKLDGIHDLPAGAGPIVFLKDFGDVAALMLTVASPRASPMEIAIRAQSVRRAIAETRAASATAAARATLTLCFPNALDARVVRRLMSALAGHLEEEKLAHDVRFVERPGFSGLDAVVPADDETLLAAVRDFTAEQLHLSDLHPDIWRPTVIRSLDEIERKLSAVAGPRYTYRELDDYTDLLKRTLQGVPLVSKVARTGVLPEAVYLHYSQERLASYGVQLAALRDVFSARNIDIPGGVLEVDGKNLAIDPSGEFKSERDIGDVIIGVSPRGAPFYLRDVADVERDYQNPPRFLNYFARRTATGEWQRDRAITLDVQMRQGEQIAEFGRQVDAVLAQVRPLLPDDLVIARTSDQPLQVRESMDLFMRSLYEAVALVVLVALVGFWHWRSAVLLALSIPLTLAMTFGMMHLLGIDVQQVSIASLIIALGLLVDDPVVAGDAIQREVTAGHPPLLAAWLGPTKLANAIVFATVTNIVAYLPLLLIKGDVAYFIYSLPIVLTCSLVASRIVSMTFVPLLGYHLLRATPVDRREPRRFARAYRRLIGWAIDNRWRLLAGSCGLLALGALFLTRLEKSFFPKDFSYYFYLDVWLPEDAPLSATNAAAVETEQVVREVTAEFGRRHTDDHGGQREVLESMTTFVGGGGPRFWFSIIPEQQALNYAQVIVQVKDKRHTGDLVDPLQRALATRVPGARVDVRQLETAEPVGIPVAVRISGDDIAVLRQLAEKAARVFRALPDAERVRNDWGAESFVVRLKVDSDRANLAGISNLDVALSSASGMSGLPLTTLREGERQIPVIARLRPEERARLSDINNLYVYSTRGAQRVPLRQVSAIDYGMETEKLLTRDQFRTITISAFPRAGILPSQVLAQARPAIDALQRTLPPGYRLEIGGEEEAQIKGFAQLSTVMLISVLLIFLALTVEFRHAFKPFIVFAAIPYGMVGALASLAIMNQPFGFMAFLGIASLIGVIVSHVIVLFDCIETLQERGLPLREALIEAGLLRLRPVLITVAATVLGLFPLALHGGPLWEPLCYAQIGGLTIATFITLLLVPVLYAIFTLDIKLIRWPAVKLPDPPR